MLQACTAKGVHIMDRLGPCGLIACAPDRFAFIHELERSHRSFILIEEDVGCPSWPLPGVHLPAVKGY